MAKKPSTKAPDLAALLKLAVDATVAGAPPFYASIEQMAPLEPHASGMLVEHHTGYADPNDPTKFAYRATPLGVQAHNAGLLAGGKAPAASAPPPSPWGAPPAATAPAAPATSAPATGAPAKVYNFQKGIPVPVARRGGRGQNAYGFEQMEVGDSQFIPKTDENPNPSKRIASTVSSASKRLKPKSFIVRSVDETADGGSIGARVWRTV